MSEGASASEPEAATAPEAAAAPEAESRRERPRDEGRATVALVLGIAGVILAWIPVISSVIGLVAIGFGVTRVRSRSRRLAMFSIALGVLAVGLNIAATSFVLG